MYNEPYLLNNCLLRSSWLIQFFPASSTSSSTPGCSFSKLPLGCFCYFFQHVHLFAALECFHLLPLCPGPSPTLFSHSLWMSGSFSTDGFLLKWYLLDHIFPDHSTSTFHEHHLSLSHASSSLSCELPGFSKINYLCLLIFYLLGAWRCGLWLNFTLFLNGKQGRGYFLLPLTHGLSCWAGLVIKYLVMPPCTFI